MVNLAYEVELKVTGGLGYRPTAHRGDSEIGLKRHLLRMGSLEALFDKDLDKNNRKLLLGMLLTIENDAKWRYNLHDKVIG